MMVSGCAQVASVMPNAKEALVIDASDPCAAQRTAFNDHRNYFTEKVLESAAIGTVAGAVMGGAIAGARGGNIGVGVLVGAASGLLVGTTAGYFSAVSEKNKDRAALSQVVNQDMTAEVARMDGVAADFARLRQCRFMESNRIKLLVKRGQQDRPSAIKQLEYQHLRFNEELELAHKIGINMQKRDTEFAQAADKMKADAIAAKAAEDKQVTMAASKTIPEKRGNFEKALGKAEAESQIAFDVDAVAIKV